MTAAMARLSSVGKSGAGLARHEAQDIDDDARRR